MESESYSLMLRLKQIILRLSSQTASGNWDRSDSLSDHAQSDKGWMGMLFDCGFFLLITRDPQQDNTSLKH